MTAKRSLRCAASVAAVITLGACGPSGGVRSAEAASASPPPAGAPVTAAQVTQGPDSVSARMDRARIQGDSTARVWLVMVSDFQCPFCKQFHDQSLPTIESRYIKTGKVRFAFLNFPLPSHANAWPAAEAAMCAGLQGKFWPYEDVLYTNQDAWAEKRSATTVLDSLAHSIGIDTSALNRCVNTHQARPLIQADQDRAEQAERALTQGNPELAQRIGSTPTFIIGSRTIIIGAQPLDAFTHSLDSALAAGR